MREALRRLSACAAALIACSPAPVDVTAASPRVDLPPLYPGTSAIVGANVVTMTGPGTLADATIVVRDGIIEAVGPRASTPVPAGADVIEGEGSWVIPGLMDMHVHLRRGDLDAYRRAGITTVRNMWGTPTVAALLEETAAGADHPTIASASPGIDGSSPVWPGTIVVTDARQARSEVMRLAEEGWRFVKVYNSLSPGVHAAVLSAARDAGIPVVGHVPFAVDLDGALSAGQYSIEHLTGIAEEVAGGRGPGGWLTLNSSRVDPVARRVAQSATWVCPTLVVLRRIATNVLPAGDAATALENQLAVIGALHRAGAPLLAGTDAGIDITPAGVSLAQELELFVSAGLTPYEALATATVDAARFLGLNDRLGSIAVGMRADLVLLPGDPLADIRAVASPLAVLQRGKRIF